MPNLETAHHLHNHMTGSIEVHEAKLATLTPGSEEYERLSDHIYELKNDLAECETGILQMQQEG